MTFTNQTIQTISTQRRENVVLVKKVDYKSYEGYVVALNPATNKPFKVRVFGCPNEIWFTKFYLDNNK